MKKTRMSLKLKYAQPLVQSLFDMQHNHPLEAKCHRPLYNMSEESMHRRLKYAMYKLSINCLQDLLESHKLDNKINHL